MDIQAIIEAAKGNDPETLTSLLGAEIQKAVDKEAGGLKAKRDELLKEVKELKEFRQQISEISDDPEELRKLVEGQSELERKLAAAQNGVDEEKVKALAKEWADEHVSAVRKEMSAQIEKEKSRAEKAEARVAELDAEITDGAFRRELLDAAGDEVWPSLRSDLFNRVRPYLARDEDGKTIARNPKTDMPIVGPKGAAMTPSEIIESLREGNDEHPWGDGRPFFKSYGGGSGHTGSTAGVTSKSIEDMDFEEYKKKRQEGQIGSQV